MSSATIGVDTIRAILRPIQPDRRRVGTEFFVVAAGTSTLGTCAFPIASAVLPVTATTTMVSVSPSEFTTRQSANVLSSERDRAKGEGLSSGADSPTTEAKNIGFCGHFIGDFVRIRARVGQVKRLFGGLKSPVETVNSKTLVVGSSLM